MIYFSYNVSHEYFHHNLLSKLCLTEESAIKELCEMHNGDEIAFFLGDDEQVSPDEFTDFRELIQHIVSIYDKYKDMTVEIKLIEYITSGSFESFSKTNK